MISQKGISFIIEQNKLAKQYIEFNNMDNKRWIITIKNSAIALNLYQPSALKGRLLKFFFPLLPISNRPYRDWETSIYLIQKVYL